MNKEIQEQINDFKLPTYEEIPNVGLYLEQVTKYINDIISPLIGETITKSMISNYVKKGLVKNPIKKQYYRDQIALLVFITLAKTVISLEDIKLLIELKNQSYTDEVAYNYLRKEFLNVIEYVFEIKSSIDTVGVDSNIPKRLLRNTIIAFAHKIYLEKSFEMLHKK